MNATTIDNLLDTCGRVDFYTLAVDWIPEHDYTNPSQTLFQRQARVFSTHEELQSHFGSFRSHPAVFGTLEDP